jgi:hypothetical protein
VVCVVICMYVGCMDVVYHCYMDVEFLSFVFSSPASRLSVSSSTYLQIHTHLFLIETF